jgi:hypothetical protein
LIRKRQRKSGGGAHALPVGVIGGSS